MQMYNCKKKLQNDLQYRSLGRGGMYQRIKANNRRIMILEIKRLVVRVLVGSPYY